MSRVIKYYEFHIFFCYTMGEIVWRDEEQGCLVNWSCLRRSVICHSENAYIQPGCLRTLNELNSLQKIRHKLRRVLSRREVSKALHYFVLRARDLIRSCLAHFGRVAPIVFACQHIDRALLGID